MLRALLPSSRGSSRPQPVVTGRPRAARHDHAPPPPQSWWSWLLLRAGTGTASTGCTSGTSRSTSKYVVVRTPIVRSTAGTSSS